MLKVKFYHLPSGNIIGFNIVGHCGYEESGKDIVCAAVSSAVYLIINTLTDVFRISARSLSLNDGMIDFIIYENDELQCRNLFKGLKIHLLGLEEIYPKNIQVDYMEV